MVLDSKDGTSFRERIDLNSLELVLVIFGMYVFSLHFSFIASLICVDDRIGSRTTLR